VHGLADDNVHPRHSLLLARELLAAGRDHELLLLPGVTHIVWQPELIEQLLTAHVRFLRRALRAGPAVTGSPEPGRLA
jgi:dipeptidyl-peptidase-4